MAETGLYVVSEALCRARQKLEPYDPGVPYLIGLVGRAKENFAALGNACCCAGYGKEHDPLGRLGMV